MVGRLELPVELVMRYCVPIVNICQVLTSIEMICTRVVMPMEVEMLIGTSKSMSISDKGLERTLVTCVTLTRLPLHWYHVKHLQYYLVTMLEGNLYTSQKCLVARLVILMFPNCVSEKQ